jgi:hypothetical protein
MIRDPRSETCGCLLWLLALSAAAGATGPSAFDFGSPGEVEPAAEAGGRRGAKSSWRRIRLTGDRKLSGSSLVEALDMDLEAG